MTTPHTIRTALVAITLTACGLAASAQAPSPTPASASATCAVEVEVKNLTPNQGRIQLAAYASSETFFKKPTAAAARDAGAETSTVIPLCDLPAGPVSVIVFQDLNGNGRLDRNPLGIPTEPWGTSGRGGSFGPPTWDGTQVPASGRIVIQL